MVSKSLAEKVVMPTASGPNLSKWAGLLLTGDVVVFTLSLLLGYLLGAQITWEQLFLQEHILSIVALCLVYLIILYIGELYNYYLDFRQRENIGQVILWALAAAVVAIIVFCFPTPKLLPRRFLEWQALAFIWLLVGWRYLFSALALPQRLKRRVIIVGAGQSGRRILDAIRRRPHAGLEHESLPLSLVLKDTFLKPDTFQWGSRFLPFLLPSCHGP
jgi:FlaA1/EpsC-like NDP-sugar epimerase